MQIYKFAIAIIATLLSTGAARAETIGFAQVGSESDWRTAFSADMKAEAARRGIRLLFSDADNNAARQHEAVRGFIASRVDAIVIAPVVVTGWTETLKLAKVAGIPVFVADRAVDTDPDLFVARIAADFNLEGAASPRPGSRKPRGVAAASWNCAAPRAPSRPSSAAKAFSRSCRSSPACASCAPQAAASQAKAASARWRSSSARPRD